jgi:hypothetical protein
MQARRVLAYALTRRGSASRAERDIARILHDAQAYAATLMALQSKDTPARPASTGASESEQTDRDGSVEDIKSRDPVQQVNKIVLQLSIDLATALQAQGKDSKAVCSPLSFLPIALAWCATARP